MSRLKFLDYTRILLRPNRLKCVVFSVTSHCPAKCKMCIYWKRLNKSDNELTLAEIKSICQRAGDVVGVILTGGEPFSRGDLDEVAYLFARYNKARLIHVSTMGYASEKIGLITERMVQRCRDVVVTVDLSIDGIGPKHDNIRGVPGLFEKVCRTYSCLEKLRRVNKRLRIKVNTVISTYNQDDVGAIVDFVKKEMRVNDHSLSLTQGNPRERDAKILSLDRCRQYSADFWATQADSKKDVFEKLMRGLRRDIGKEIMQVRETNKLTSPCRAIKNFVFIDEEGGVYPCAIIEEKIGDLRVEGYDLKRILASRKRYFVEKKYNISSCSCDWDCGYLFNIIYDPRKYAGLIGHLFDHDAES